MEQIATFHTHLGALRLKKKLDTVGDADALMMPVPRKLSASCGTCVRFSVPFRAEWANEDLDSVFLSENGEYRILFVNSDDDSESD